MRESDPRFANLERRVGVFLVVSVLIVAAVIGAVGWRQGLFTPKSALVFHDDSGRDLAEGMEVFTRGFRIGKVRGVRLDEAGRVEVTLAIERRLFRWVRKDSTARVIPKTFIGDSLIEISPGTPQAGPMPADSEIPFVREPDLSDIAKRVMEEVTPVLTAVRGLVEYLDDPRGDVKQSIANINRLSAGLVETRGRLDETIAQVGARVESVAANLDAVAAALRTETLPQVTGLVARGAGAVDDADRTVRSLDAFVREDLHGLTEKLRTELIPQLQGVVADAGRAAAAAGSGAERVNRDLPALLEKVNAGLEKTNASLENMRAITAELVPAAKEAAGLVRQGGELVEDSEALVKRTGELWPFRTGPKQPGTTVDVDSYPPKTAPPAGPAAGPRAR